MAYAVGLPAYVLIKVVGPAFFARQDTRTPVIVASGCMVVNVVLNLILMQYLLHAGLALATAISAWLNISILMLILIRRGQFLFDARLRRRGPAIILSAAVMALAVWLGTLPLAGFFQGGELSRFLSIGALVALGLAVFVGASFLTGAARTKDLRQIMRRDPG